MPIDHFNLPVRVEHMRRHIEELCDNEDISAEICRSLSQAWAARDLMTISIRPIKSSKSYVTALHEIGHIQGQHQDDPDVMVRERWAWRWARANALIWTPVMERYRWVCLRHAQRVNRPLLAA